MYKHTHDHKEHDDEEEHLHYHGVDKAEKHIRVDDALSLFLKNIEPVRAQFVGTSEAQSRVLYDDIKSKTSVPALSRSTRDGFALKLRKGETSYSLVGDVRIGVTPNVNLGNGEAAYIATGAFLPGGADAVVMKEYARVDQARSKVIIGQEPRKFENILQPGEDIVKGKSILKKGTSIRPQHSALISMLGMKKVRIFRRPRVAYFSTGDELIDAGKMNNGRKAKLAIYDANRPFIGSMLSELGIEPHDLGIVKDDYEAIKSRIVLGLKNYDGLILSAGSSVGERDFALRAAQSINGVKLLVHGVAMRPSSPTGLAVYGKRPFILLPGFPTSAIVSFYVFALPALTRLSGKITDDKFPIIKVKFADSYPGKEGIKHYVRVKVSMVKGEYVAKIVKPTEAYYSRWLAEANAIAIVDEGSSPVHEGDYTSALLIGGTA